MTQEGAVAFLSEREQEVLKLVATGATNQQIARALVISPNTVKVHLRNIFEKLGVQSRTEATMEAVRRGLVPVASATLIVASATLIAEGAAPPAAEPEPPPILLTERMGRPGLAAWQRVYFVAAIVLVILAALAPSLYRGGTQAAPSTRFSDVGQPQVNPAAPVTAARWSSSAAMPAARSRHALVANGAKVYAIGGEAADGVSDEVTVYDPRSNGWLPAARKPTPVSNIAGVSLGARIYVPGGTTATGGVTNVLEVYDVQADTWEARAPLPAAVAAYGLAAVDGKIYLFGGWDGQAYRSEVYIYDPVSDAWSEGVALPTPRAFLAAAALNKLIYVAGGEDGRQELAEVLSYDTSVDPTVETPWTIRSPLSQGRAGHAMTAAGARLYVVGGGWRDSLAYNEQYDSRLDAWSKFGTPIVGQWRNLGLAVADGKLFAAGGWSGSYLAVNEAYQVLLRQLLPSLGGKGG
jgi:DNA-binding CsgD family transcriptional regulator/N-acetylneuraminic acid mutarotase